MLWHITIKERLREREIKEAQEKEEVQKLRSRSQIIDRIYSDPRPFN